MRVTAHSGMLSQNPQSSIVCTILGGITMPPFPVTPDDIIIFEIMPKYARFVP